VPVRATGLGWAGFGLRLALPPQRCGRRARPRRHRL